MNSFWGNRTAFVTGANGFVGSHLVRRLTGRGAKIVCLQRDAVRGKSLELFDLQDKITIIKGAIDDFSLLKEILDEYEIDAVFHLAAQALVGAANNSPLSTFETNIRGTYLLLEACRQSKNVKRIVVASSDKAYGSHESPPLSENFALRGRFPYDVSKACADLISQSYARSYDLPVAIVRAANIYGPGDLNLSRIIPGTIISILKNENPIIRSDGTPIRDFVYIDDVIDGYLLLAENIEKAHGEAFNFGTNKPIQMLDLVKLILETSGKTGTLTPEVALKTKIEREIDAQYLSTEKMNEFFGWSAKIDLKDGLRETFDWYREYLSQIT